MEASDAARRSGTAFRRVHLYLAFLVPASVFAFWKTYFGVLDDLPETITPVIHIHALLMYVWVFMLIAQAWFVRTRRLPMHRWLGRSSYGIAPLVFVSGLSAMHEVLNRDPDGVTAELARLNVLGFGQIVAYGVTWGLAIAYRKQTPLHVRFMISTALAIATAIVFRVFFLWVPGFTPEAAVAGNCVVLSLLTLSLVAADWRMGVKRSPYWVVTVLLGLMHLGFWTFAKTDGWLAFHRWFADLL